MAINNYKRGNQKTQKPKPSKATIVFIKVADIIWNIYLYVSLFLDEFYQIQVFNSICFSFFAGEKTK